MAVSENIVLSAEGLGQSFEPAYQSWLRDRPARRPLHNVSLSLSAGASLGIVGANGAGKATLLRVLTGQERPYAGRVRFLSHDFEASTRKQRRSLQRKIQYLACDPLADLNLKRSANDIVSASLRSKGKAGWQGRKPRVAEALRMLGISHLESRKPLGALSLFDQHRVAIAAAIVSRPSLMVLDEWGRGLDVAVQAQLYKLMLDVQDAMELTMVVSSPNLNLAGNLCDSLLILKDGHVVEEGPAPQILSQPKHPHSFYLLSQARAAEYINSA